MPTPAGPFTYLVPGDRVSDIPGASENNAKKLAGPRETSGTLASTTVPADVSTFTLLPGLSTSGCTLTAANGPWLFEASLQGWVEATRMDLYHRFRIRVTQGDGSVWTSDRNSDQCLFKGGSFRISLHNHLVVKPGATQIVARVEYRTPSSTTLSLQNALLELTPIRPVVL